MKLFFTLLVFVLLTTFSVFAQKQTDRDVNRLSGDVKKVVQETAKIVFENETVIESERFPNSIVTYDIEGNLLKSDVFYKGILYIRTIFGYFDEERISREIKFPENENFPPFAVQLANEDSKQAKKYTHKFEYDDNGRRIEEKIFLNGDVLFLHNTINYNDKGNQTEWNRYSADGKLNMKCVFDENGDATKVIFPTHMKAYEDSIFIFDEYNFDSQGNWIKRTIKKLITENGQLKFAPFQVEYRKITYFIQK
ncbi:hypothetical protein BH24ACI2_BH24ACI2_14650 [soil metagenome]|jgi:hypothetical protein|nr:hypothetical protein [Acidobacteriota bacterium]